MPQSYSLRQHQLAPASVEAACRRLIELPLVDLAGSRELAHRLAAHAHAEVQSRVVARAQATHVARHALPVLRTILLEHARGAKRLHVGLATEPLPPLRRVLLH